MPLPCLDLVCPMNGPIVGEAVSCDCDLTGSTSGICNAKGGQCECKPNVVGRRLGLKNEENCIFNILPVVTVVLQVLMDLVLLAVLLVIVTRSVHFQMLATNNLDSVYAVSEALPVANVTNANLDFGIENIFN